MDNFENEWINGIYISQYVASWFKKGGSFPDDYMNSQFADWLRTLTFLDTNGNIVGLSEDAVHRIVMFATNGKLELEDRAKKFIHG